MLGIHIFVNNLTSDIRTVTLDVESQWYGADCIPIVTRRSVPFDVTRARDIREFTSQIFATARDLIAPK